MSQWLKCFRRNCCGSMVQLPRCYLANFHNSCRCEQQLGGLANQKSSTSKKHVTLSSFLCLFHAWLSCSVKSWNPKWCTSLYKKSHLGSVESSVRRHDAGAEWTQPVWHFWGTAVSAMEDGIFGSQTIYIPRSKMGSCGLAMEQNG